MRHIRWRIAAAAGLGMIGSAGSALLPPGSYIPPAPWLMSVETAHRTAGEYELPPPREGLVAEGFDYSDEGGLPWQSDTVAAAARKGCPGGDGRFVLPDGVMMTEAAGAAVIRPFVLVATAEQALLLRRYPQIVGAQGCHLTVRYRGSIDRAFVVGGTVTTFHDLGGSNPPFIRSDRAEAGRNGLLDNLLIPVIDLAEARYHQPHGGTARMRAPIAGVKTVCFDMSSKLVRAHECYLDDGGPWQGLMLEAHGENSSGGLNGTLVTDLRQNVPIEGRLFEWDRPITLAQ
ncbi:MAG: hypothetical protein J0M19_09955 [Sphingomonadales bacterium]|nr:hypothetical protein [Sphingomonadales bacterium]